MQQLSATHKNDYVNCANIFQIEEAWFIVFVIVLYTSVPLYMWCFWWDFQLDLLLLFYKMHA